MTWKDEIIKQERTDKEAIDEARKLIVKAFSTLERQLGSDEGLDKFEYLVDDLLKSM